MVLQDGFCKKCGEKYTKASQHWCKPCQIGNLKGNFTSWTSGNEKIDEFIQEMQLKIKNYDDIVFEWIPYNQFKNINKDIDKGNLTTVYSAIWKNGPLCYEKKWTRKSDTNVALECLNNSQNITYEFLNEV